MPRPQPAPTIIDVAAHAGVSKSVVSRVLTGAPGVAQSTRDRVQRSAAELGYVANAMARGMSAHRTHTIGAFVRDAARPFYGHLLTAMQERAAQLGYRVVTATGSGSFSVAEERRALEVLVSLRVEGLVVCSGALPSEDVLVHAARVPVLVAGRPEQDPRLASVACDETGGGTALAEHVLSLGHRRVVVVSHALQESFTMHPRTAAMVRLLAARGAEVHDLPRSTFAGSRAQVADQVLHHVRALGATAVMMPADRDALEVLEALERQGLAAPKDLSVTGYDGIGELASPVLGITSWRQPVHDVGRLAVEQLVALVDGTGADRRRVLLEGTLVAGRTAGAVHGGR